MAFTEIETGFAASVGLDEIANEQRPFALKHNVSFGDFIEFAGAVGVSNCGGGPRLKFLAGRSNHSVAAPDGLIPLPSDTTDHILQLMGAAGISAAETVDLLAALLTGDWAVVDSADQRPRREARGLVAAYLNWHLERSLRSLPLVEEEVSR